MPLPRGKLKPSQSPPLRVYFHRMASSYHGFRATGTAIRPFFEFGLINFPPSEMGFTLFGHRAFNMRTLFGTPNQRQAAGIVKNSKINVSLPLFRKSVIVAAGINTFDNDEKITVGSEEETPKQEIAGNSETDKGDPETVVNEVEGFDGKGSITVENISQNGSIRVQKMDMGRSISSLKAYGTTLWDSWNSWNVQYQKDIRVWGVGHAPIFVVYQSANGEVLKVLVNEDEILRRSGAVPFLADRPDETAISNSHAKIAQAKQLARDIETGVLNPRGNSTLFEFVSPDKNDLGKWGLLGSVFCQARSVIGPAPPALKFSLVLFVLLSGVGFVWAARKYMFRNGQMLGEETEEEKQKIAGRKINSMMEKEKGNDRYP